MSDVKLPSDELQHIQFEGCDVCVIAPEDYDALAAEVTALKKRLQFFEERANSYPDEWHAIVDAWADDNGQFGVGA